MSKFSIISGDAYYYHESGAVIIDLPLSQLLVEDNMVRKGLIQKINKIKNPLPIQFVMDGNEIVSFATKNGNQEKWYYKGKIYNYQNLMKKISSDNQDRKKQELDMIIDKVTLLLDELKNIRDTF